LWYLSKAIILFLIVSVELFGKSFSAFKAFETSFHFAPFWPCFTPNGLIVMTAFAKPRYSLVEKSGWCFVGLAGDALVGVLGADVGVTIGM